MNDTPLEQLTLDRFAVLVTTRFRLRSNTAGQIDLVLVEAATIPPIAPVGAVGARARQDRFHLHFDGPEHRLLPQGIYRLEHASLGTFELFLVPIGREAGIVRYEAVFNRFVCG